MASRPAFRRWLKLGPAHRRWLKVLLLVVALGLAGVALADGWSSVRDHVSKLAVGTIVEASVFVLLADFAAVMCWRALLSDIGSRLSITAAARIVFLGGLAKYIPGSVWLYLAQMELGRDHHVPRQRSGAVSVLYAMMVLIASLALAAATLPWASPSATRRYWSVFLVVPIVGAAIHPSILNRLLSRVLRILKRQPFDQQFSWRGIGKAVAWALIGAAGGGISVWLLARDIAHAGAGALPVCVGASTLAWAAGFLFVIAPAGAGVREAVLVAALSPIMSASAGLTIALLSRLLIIGGDLIAACIALLISRHVVVSREPPSELPDAKAADSPGDAS